MDLGGLLQVAFPTGQSPQQVRRELFSRLTGEDTEAHS